jgi:hypothetical protein
MNRSARLLLIATAAAAAFAAFASAVLAVRALVVLTATALFAVAHLTAAARRFGDIGGRGSGIETKGAGGQGDERGHQ